MTLATVGGLAAAPPVATVRVARTSLVTTMLTPGTLGYAATSPVA